MAYIDWLNKISGGDYRLPTEAEWEYAARGDSIDRRVWGDNRDEACTYANVSDTSTYDIWSYQQNHGCYDGFHFTAPVGSYLSNNYALADMLGNVWEWTCSVYIVNYNGAETRCVSQHVAGRRVLRGGSYDDIPAQVRTAYRWANEPWSRHSHVGF